MKRTRVVAVDLHPDRLQGGFLDEPVPAISIEPLVGYLKEMSPHLPVSHEIQLRGHWVGEERDAMASKIPLKEVNPLVPPMNFVAFSDLLGDILSCLLHVDPATHPLFLSIRADQLQAHGDKIAEIVYDGLCSPSFMMTWNVDEDVSLDDGSPRDGSDLASWHRLASRAREAWQRGIFVPRTRYLQAGPSCLPFVDKQVLG